MLNYLIHSTVGFRRSQRQMRRMERRTLISCAVNEEDKKQNVGRGGGKRETSFGDTEDYTTREPTNRLRYPLHGRHHNAANASHVRMESNRPRSPPSQSVSYSERLTEGSISSCAGRRVRRLSRRRRDEPEENMNLRDELGDGFDALQQRIESMTDDQWNKVLSILNEVEVGGPIIGAASPPVPTLQHTLSPPAPIGQKGRLGRTQIKARKHR